jgi:hypothetical protein
MTDEELHTYARGYAERKSNEDFDRKLLRFNDIIACAKTFYPNTLLSGIREGVDSCIRGNSMYVPKRNLPTELSTNYRWLLG